MRQGATTYNTGVWVSSNTRITSTDWIQNVKAGTYTISAKTSTTKTLQVSIVTFNTSGVFNNVSGVSGQWKTMPFTFTIPIDMNLKCNIKYSNETAITPSEVTEVQLESGSVATEFSPYNHIELCKIGNYQDKIYYDSGKWYLHKEVGKVVLNGSETWGQNSAQTLTNTSLYFTNIIDNVADISKNTLSNFFEYKQLWNTDVQGVYLYIGGNGLRIRINTSIASSVNSFKTWLSTHNTTVYYVLDTPTTEEITDTYLLNQLNEILDMELYENLCYVDWIGIEKPTMNLRYYVDTDKILERLREE